MQVRRWPRNLLGKAIRLSEPSFRLYRKGSGKFDYCFMLHIIEHMKDMLTAIKLIEDVRDHLMENGKLILTSPVYSKWKTDFYDCDFTNHLLFAIKRLRQLLSNLGFQIVHETICVDPIFGYKGVPCIGS